MNKPNILLLFADQMRFDAMGAMGSRIIKTPNMDRLAAQGVLFTNAISSAPLCTPARSCTILGHSATKIGVYGNDEPLHYQAAEALPRLLKSQGYFSQAVGKMHFGGPPYQVTHGMDNMILSEEMRGLRWAKSLDDVVFDDYDKFLIANKRFGWEKPPEIGYNEIKPLVSPVEKEFHITQWCGDETVKWLRENRPKDKPFFLWSSFVKPHVPYDCPRHLLDLYNEDDMPEPRVSPYDGTRKNPLFEEYRESSEFNLYSQKAAKRALAYYYANITFIDEQIGRILAELENQGIADDTIVIFTSDHGDMMGDHGLWYKSFGYEGSLHIPLIMRVPDKFQNAMPDKLNPGTVCDSIVSHLDIYPTIIEAAGAVSSTGADNATGAERPGLSLFNLPEIQKRNLGVSEMFRGRRYVAHLRTKKWKLLFHANGGFIELYDMEKDPYEIYDLADRPEFANIVSELKTQCEQYLSKYGDADEVLDANKTLKQYPYQKPAKILALKPFSRMPWDYRFPPSGLSDDEKGWFWNSVDGDWHTVFERVVNKNK